MNAGVVEEVKVVLLLVIPWRISHRVVVVNNLALRNSPRCQSVIYSHSDSV